MAEISGKLIKKLGEVTGTGKNGTNWIKQEFVIETQEQYPKKVCLAAWGDRTQDLSQIADGETLKIQFSPESREYNERWYTELRAYRIERMGAETTAPASVPSNVEFNASTGAAKFPPMAAAAEGDDDLPF